jgi:hypothetical protein
MSDNQETINGSADKKSSCMSRLCFWRNCSASDGVEKPFSLGLFILLVCVVTIALIGYFTSKAALSVQMVETRLAQWADVVKESAARRGYDANLKYGAISIEGGLFSKRAVISSPSLVLESNGKAIESFATARVELVPDSSAMNKVTLLLPAPVKITRGNETARYEASAPVSFVIESQGEGQSYQAAFPEKIHVFHDDQTGANAIPYATLETQLGGKIVGFIGSGAEEYSQRIELKQTSYKTADRTLRADNVYVQAEAAKEDAAHLTHYDVKLNKVSTSGIFSVLSPMDVVMDVDRSTPAVVAAKSSAAQKEVSYYVNSLSVTSGSTVFGLTGKFDVMPNEILPLGSAELSVSSVNGLLKRLRSANVLDARSEEITRGLLQKVAAEWTQGDKDTLKLIVEREYGGGFFIGDVTFEELFAMALKAYLLDTPEPESIPLDHGHSTLDPETGLDTDAGQSSGDAVSTDKSSEKSVGTKAAHEDKKTDATHEPVAPAAVKKSDTKTDAVTPVKEDKHSAADKDAAVTPSDAQDDDASVVAPTGDAEQHTAPTAGESPAAMESLEDGDADETTNAKDAKAVPAAKQEKESVGDSLKKIFSKMAN